MLGVLPAHVCGLAHVADLETGAAGIRRCRWNSAGVAVDSAHLDQIAHGFLRMDLEGIGAPGMASEHDVAGLVLAAEQPETALGCGSVKRPAAKNRHCSI